MSCDFHSDTFLIKLSKNPWCSMSLKICYLLLNVIENMPFSLNKSSTLRLPLQNAMRVQVTFLEKFARKICGDISYRYIVNEKELRSGIINFWLVVYGLPQFLVRGGSW